MKATWMTSILCVGICHLYAARALDLEYVRQQVEKAVFNKEVCESMIHRLNKHVENDVYLAYLGIYQTISANHIGNPFRKFMLFNQGKNNIDQAVRQSANNIEIRFIRLSVQKNCPAFLGYHDYILQDEAYLARYKDTISSATLRNMIDKLLKN